jgi:hypothetical protein
MHDHVNAHIIRLQIRPLRTIDALPNAASSSLHLPGPRRGLFLKKRKTTGRVGRRKFLQFHEIYLERRHFVRVG